MKHNIEHQATGRSQLLSIALVLGFAMPLPALAASVALATSPLATSTTSTVKPNLLFILDNSGSMDWDHMPDDASDGGSAVSFNYGYYGLRSNQCNQVYYNPATTYKPPVDSAGNSYADASFTGAWINGFNTGSGTVNLNTSFKASLSLNADTIGVPAYYYNYSGVQNSLLQKNYNSTTNTFYSECNSAQSVSPGKDVFTKISLSNTASDTTATIVATCSSCTSTSVSSIKLNGVELMASTPSVSSTSPSALAADLASKITLNGVSASASSGTITLTGLNATASSLIVTQSGNMTLSRTIYPIADAAKLKNFANWYSYYRTRLLMMKTAAGRAFSSLNNSYRVGLMKISASDNPSQLMGTFESTQRSNWYTTLYNTSTSGSTPLRTALSDAGRYYAGKLAVTDPVQYSCQQNFSILSTDGYWNSGDDYQLDGSTLVGNQDGTAGRPMYDGAQAGTSVTTTYTRNNYTRISSGCTSTKKRLLAQPQMQTCSITTVAGVAGPEICTAWSNSGPNDYVPPYSSDSATCSSTVTLPTPNPSVKVQSGSPVTAPGSAGGSSDSLADVAMYYYQTDLRTPALGNCGSPVSPATVGPLCDNNVFINGNDNNTQQHMTTFTLGLGASGWMNYSSSYLSDTSGDFFAVKLGSTANSSATPPVCSWQANGTICNWPLPGMDTSGNGRIANIDDLWHAAVDGHGAYFSATDSASLSAGLSNALAGISARKGSAAAAATSTLNPVAGNNYAFVASYTTVAWKGNLEARYINVDTGAVSESASWCVENVVAGTCPAPSTVVADNSGSSTTYNCVTPNSVICTGGTLSGSDCLKPVAIACTGTMNGKVADTSDTRTIKTSNGAALVNFDAAFAAGNPNFSAAHISTLSQWSSLTPAQQAAASGSNLVNYLRGQYSHEDRSTNAAADRLYRFREAVLGDALESQPVYIAEPVFPYPYPGYSAFVTANAARAGTVYMGANDGMLHAFASDTGIERWAYVPSMVIPNMWKLADTNYASLHNNYVNGNAVIGDIYDGAWKTILVGGLNGGGRGYYALDITDPAAPQLLWEFTTTAGVGTVKDDDLGYSYGQPVITRKADGSWVVLVTSGYNNSSPGTGQGYLYVLDAGTGAKISKISTGVGTTSTPSGLSKIAGWNLEPGGNKVGYVYGGDLQGNLWRFDINSPNAADIGNGAVMKLAALKDPGGAAQAVTTTPILGLIAGKRVIFIGTGKYLETADLTTSQKQTQYAIKDDDEIATLGNLRSLLVNQTLTNNTNGTSTRTVSNNAVDFYYDQGWYVDFPDNGERVNIDSKLVQGTLLVPTIVPSNTVCSPGGYGWLNYFDYKTGGAVDLVTNLASTKSDATIVGINILYIQGKTKVGVVTSVDPTPHEPPISPDFAPDTPQFQNRRVIWRELIP